MFIENILYVHNKHTDAGACIVTSLKSVRAEQVRRPERKQN